MNDQEEKTEQRYAEGLWYIKGNSRHWVCKIDEKKVKDFSRILSQKNELSSYLYILNQQYISANLDIQKDGTIRYAFPSNWDVTEKIIEFLCLTPEKQAELMDKTRKEITKFDFYGNVVNLKGDLVYKKDCAGQITARMKELKKELRKLREMLPKKLIEEL